MELSDIWITRRDKVGTMKLAQYPYSDNCGKPNHISPTQKFLGNHSRSGPGWNWSVKL